jgi:hypothetical protein
MGIIVLKMQWLQFQVKLLKMLLIRKEMSLIQFNQKILYHSIVLKEIWQNHCAEEWLDILFGKAGKMLHTIWLIDKFQILMNHINMLPMFKILWENLNKWREFFLDQILKMLKKNINYYLLKKSIM